MLRALRRTGPIVLGALFCLSQSAWAQLENPAPSPPENPVLPGQIELGKILFHEEQMSFDNSMACATCHILERGGADPREATHPGADGLFGTSDDVVGSPGVVNQDGNGLVHEDKFFPHVQVTGRHAPPVINSANGQESLFWDGRAGPEFLDPVTGEVLIVGEVLFGPPTPGGAPESQAAGPPESSVEMGAAGFSWTDIANKIAQVRPLALATNIPVTLQPFMAANPTYPDMFNAVYGDPAVTPARIIFAIANYERQLVSDQAPIDIFLAELEAFEAGGEVGVEPTLPPDLQPGWDVFNAFDCDKCHEPPEFLDGDFHDIGVAPELNDGGVGELTLDEDDIGMFKTASLRNLKLRGTYFHDGSASTIDEALDLYIAGGNFPNTELDGDIEPLVMTSQMKVDLRVFLRDALLDPRVEQGLPPFDRPTLRSELGPANRIFGVAQQDSFGGNMTVIANSPPNIGNGEFLVGVDEARPSEIAIFALSLDEDPLATPFSVAVPVPMNIDPAQIFLFMTRTTDAFGVASFKLPLPDDATLVGATIFGQVFCTDAGSTGGLYGSEGVEIEFL